MIKSTIVTMRVLFAFFAFAGEGDGESGRSAEVSLDCGGSDSVGAIVGADAASTVGVGLGIGFLVG